MKFDRILVTGGLGLIGSHLVERAVKAGTQVTVLDNRATGSASNLSSVKESEKLEIVIGDVTDSDLVSKLVKNMDFCFHLAASLGVKKILNDPINSLRTNIHGTDNVLISATNHEVPVFLASTSEVYGKNPSQPLSEDSDRVLGSPLNFRWSYSEAKAIDESLAQMYSNSMGLKFIIGRFFNTVGPRQVGDYGMVLPRFVKAALNNEDIEVYGDGEQTRVFCHVRDAVNAIMSLVESPNAVNDVFNIGGVGETSINQLASLVIEQTKSNSRIKHVPYSAAYSKGFEETFRRVPDISKIKNLTGWVPDLSLNQIIRDVADWHLT
jgi:UDP-glucose 4-epimerase